MVLFIFLITAECTHFSMRFPLRFATCLVENWTLSAQHATHHSQGIGRYEEIVGGGDLKDKFIE